MLTNLKRNLGLLLAVATLSAVTALVPNTASAAPSIVPNTGVGADPLFDFVRHLWIFPQEVLDVFPALANPLIAVGEPGAGFIDNAGFHAKIDQFAHF